MGAEDRLRRTQAERRADTRARLIDAAINSIVQFGYAATTVRGVATQARVSPGAATHHFSHRDALIAAAVEALADRRIENLQLGIERVVNRTPGDTQVGLEVLHEALSGPLFAGWIRLWIAAADDERLRDCMATAERRVSGALRTAARQLLQRGDDPAFGARAVVVLSTLLGLGLQEQFEPRVRARQTSLWPAHRMALETILAAPPSELQSTE